MPMFGFLALVLAIAFLVCPADQAASVEPPQDRDKAQERLEVLRMWKMMEALNLDKATADKIFGIRAKYVGEQKQLRKGVQEDIRKLRSLLKEPPTGTVDRELDTLLNDIRAKREELHRLWNKQYEDVSKILSVRQQAELMLFLKDFRQEIRSLLYPGGQPPPGPGRGLGRKEGQPPPLPRVPLHVPADPDDFPANR